VYSLLSYISQAPTLRPCCIRPTEDGPLKTAYGGQVERLGRGGGNATGKEHFTSLYKPARERAFTPKNIKAGFAASSLFLFSPERVLRTVPKPPAELSLAVTNETPYQEDDVVQTPVTSVSVEGLMSLVLLTKRANGVSKDAY
jgi:hypothetical protein